MVCDSFLGGVGGEAEEEPARRSRDYADCMQHDLYLYKWVWNVKDIGLERLKKASGGAQQRKALKGCKDSLGWARTTCNFDIYER